MPAYLIPVAVRDGDDFLAVYVPAPYEFELTVPSDDDRTVVLDGDDYDFEVSSW